MVEADYREIPLTRGKVAVVDVDDYERFCIYKWFCNNNGYAVRNAVREGRRTTVLLHREIMNAPVGAQLDHIDRDKLNDRKANLRFCSPAENNMNKGLQRNNISRYRGVSWDTETGKWVAIIAINKKETKLGRFARPEDAAFMFNQAAKKHFGEFARLNKLPSGYKFDAARIKAEKLSRLPSDNSSGVRGVVWDKSKRKWQAQIQINKKPIFLGRFDNFYDAVKARRDAEIKML